MRFYPFVSTGNGASSRGTRRADNARGQFETGRFLFWTEDSRMHAAINEKFYSYYTYDHSGVSCGSREQLQACLSYAEMEQRRRSQRRLKLVGDNCSMDVNAEYMNASSALNEPTLYPSAYMVLTKKGYTKHYYAGTERVAARLGGGGLNAQYHVISNDGVLQTKADMLFGQSLEQVNSRVLNENDLDCIMSNEFAKEEFGHWIDGIPNQMKADVEFDYSKFSGMVNSMLTDYHNGQEEVYFYHSDHLGSASWITDFEGIAVQHLQYMPYGEPYVNRRISGYSERFTFTGKERDAETGYSYFGARYYDSDLSGLFLSVDPMSDKYSGISPYAYCAWNPVKLVDPDGRELIIVGRKGKTTTYTPGMTSDGLDRFTRKVVDALNVIYGADSGIQLIDDLSNPSGNIFKIKKSRTNKFIETNKTKANKIQYMTDPVFSGIYNDTPSKSVFEVGSGGEIMWNPNGTMISTTQGAKINPIVDLAHEINGTHFEDDYQQFKTESGLPVALLTLKK